MGRYRLFFVLAFALAQSVAMRGFAKDALPADAFPSPGRPVASIVSPIWHSEDERDAAKEVQQVVGFLGIKPGMTVADIGAGSGYYVVRLSPLVGDAGRIIAEDVTPAYLQALKDKIQKLQLHNVTVTLGLPHDPKLPPGSADRVLLIHMYHEIQQPFAMLYNLAPALKPGAKIGIVDATRNTAEHGTPHALLMCELKAMGYQETAFHPLEGSAAYLAVFELAPGTEPTPPKQIVPCPEEQ